ncbi:hypothetical protein CTAYLR_002013 [Chrysophaeum taylorii]|uniref:CS domain-containing protein n=1 Tax=Chrysophaeum taylorii TaxID=2483200 RepID=A0AAD7U8Z9_9STRA|nr:hypothetical protein CTAYLR_002013 [Chrysophaeum taylorii]
MAAVEEETMTHEERIAYLRSRGVEMDLVYDKSGGGNRRAPPREDAVVESTKEFKFVSIPADVTKAMTVETAPRDYREGDSLKEWVGPRFGDAGLLDAEVCERETRGQLEKMASTAGLAAPKTATIQELAASGGAEAYPLSQPSEENGWEAIRLYVDEVGSLRQRPRNPRAERFAAEAAGLTGLRVHGDAYVGRTMVTPHGIENLDFLREDLEPRAPWAVAARATHAKEFETMPSDAKEMKRGTTNTYDWSQTAEDLEVSVKVGSAVSKKTVRVAYGAKGQSLFVDANGERLVSVPRLFARIAPDDSSWTIDGDRVVVSMEKVDAREWTALELL